MKKGFTLIELLAVIVILAVIAVIAVPIVLNIINDTKESATLRSADFYLDGVETALATSVLKGITISDGAYSIMEDGNICIGTLSSNTCTGDILKVEMDGEVPNSGTITITKGQIGDISLKLSDKTITKNNKGELVFGEGKACTLTEDNDKNGAVSKGDKITCSTESFYVISNDNKTISMLSEYNLDVGQIWNDEIGDYEEITNPTGIQNKEAIGYTPNLSKYYGVSLFSSSDSEYWYDYDNEEYLVDTNYSSEGREYPYVYGDYAENAIYTYVKDYEDYLIESGVTSAKTTLISYEQLKDLGCDENERTCALSPYEWTYSTTYWTGSAAGDGGVWGVDSYGGFVNADYSSDVNYGVRPVVNISVNEL